MQQSKTKRKNDNLWQHLAWALYVPSALIATAYSLLVPVLPIYAGNLTDAYALVGIMLASEAFGTVIGDIPSSWFIRRIGLKRTMMMGIVMSMIPMFLLFFAESIWVAMALLFAAGLGHAFYNISRHAYITVVIRQGVRGRAISVLGGVFRFGKFAGPLLGGWVGGTFGLRYAFLTFVVLASLTLVFVALFMERVIPNDPDEPENQDNPQDNTSTRHLLGVIWREHRGTLLSAGAGQILAQLTRQGWSVLLPLYAANVLELDVQTIGLIMGIGSSFDLMLFFTAGIIMDKWGRKWAIVPSFVLQGAGIFGLLFAGDAQTLTLLAVFIGISNGISSGTMMTLGADLAPRHARGEFLSVWRLIGDAGFMTGPIIVGTIAQLFVLQASIVAVGTIGWGAASLFAFFVPETLKKQKRSKQT
jgi:MFS family permease